MLHNHLVLDEREHGIPATESEESDFQIREEELPEDHGLRVLSR